MQEFLTNSTKYIGHLDPYLIYVNNRISVDFGFPKENFNVAKKDISKIAHFITDISERFDFILVFEYLEESLVLLRRMLGWSTKDIIYLNLNEQNPKKDTREWTHRNTYSRDVVRKFEKFAPLDVALYKYSLQTFKKKLQEQTEDFHSELRQFRHLQKKVFQACTNRNRKLPRLFPETRHSGEVYLTSRDCDVMQSQEEDLYTEAVQEQIQISSGFQERSRRKKFQTYS